MGVILPKLSSESCARITEGISQVLYEHGYQILLVNTANGTVSTIFDTHHAVGLTPDNGAELLIHIGINTVELNGEGFTAHGTQCQDA